MRQRIRSEDDDDSLITASSNEAATSSLTSGSSIDNLGNDNCRNLNAEAENHGDRKVEQQDVIFKPKSNSLLSFDDVEGLFIKVCDIMKTVKNGSSYAWFTGDHVTVISNSYLI